MPLVRIFLQKGKPKDHVRAIADGVHQALVETYGVPPGDRFQFISHYEPDDFIFDDEYLGIHRTADAAFIHIVASRWRDTAQKKALYKAIADRLAAKPGLRREDVQVILSPNEREDWSFGRGVASYAESDEAAPPE